MTDIGGMLLWSFDVSIGLSLNLYPVDLQMLWLRGQLPKWPRPTWPWEPVLFPLVYMGKLWSACPMATMLVPRPLSCIRAWRSSRPIRRHASLLLHVISRLMSLKWVRARLLWIGSWGWLRPSSTCIDGYWAGPKSRGFSPNSTNGDLGPKLGAHDVVTLIICTNPNVVTNIETSNSS